MHHIFLLIIFWRPANIFWYLRYFTFLLTLGNIVEVLIFLLLSPLLLPQLASAVGINPMKWLCTKSFRIKLHNFAKNGLTDSKYFNFYSPFCRLREKTILGKDLKNSSQDCIFKPQKWKGLGKVEQIWLLAQLSYHLKWKNRLQLFKSMR